MNDESTAEHAFGDALTDDELNFVVGGGEDPIKSIKGIGEN